MVVLWITEWVHVAVPALLPLVLFPLLGVLPLDKTAANYSHPVIFLFMGGFFLSLALEKWGLHRILAGALLRRWGRNEAGLLLGLMVLTAFLSMWMSNTAAVLMMLPVVLSWVKAVPESHSSFRSTLLLGLAYAATIGGMATPIGTPPNAFFVGYAEKNLHRSVGFLEWMKVGFPVAILLLATTWLFLTRTLRKGFSSALPELKKNLSDGKKTEWGFGQKVTAGVFGLAILGWMGQDLLKAVFPQIPWNDTSIAMGAALLLFLTPVNFRRREFVLDWEWASKLPWDVLLIFGGGLALAEAMASSGVTSHLASSVGFMNGLPPVFLALGLVVLTLVLSEIASNTAVAAAMIPLTLPLSQGLNLPPLALGATVALASSLGFMLPVATPPNTIVYGTKMVSASRMMREGFWINVMGILLVGCVGYLISEWVLR